MEYKVDDKNASLWRLVEKTDPKYLKDVSLGSRRFKSIDPHYQMLQATKVFGSYGKLWGVKDEVFNNVVIGSKEANGSRVDIMICNYQATFYYPDGEFPIHSAIKFSYLSNQGKHIIDDEYSKKVATNALNKGLSKLGFNADVFMGAFDDDKYNYEGIDNTGIQDEATVEQLQEIINLKQGLKPDQVLWVDKQVKKGLSRKQADSVIESIKGVK